MSELYTQGLKAGQLLQEGRYRIEKMLGKGAFGITYLAKTKLMSQMTMGTMKVEAQVAIKEFFMSDVNNRNSDGTSVEGATGSVFGNYRKKFRKEAENLSKLSCPNIVNVFDVFDENNTTYYVMEYVEGTNLDEYIGHKGFLKEAEAITVIKEIGRALSYMHSHRMLHLDVKPKNIMRKPDGKVFLIDFGLSKLFTDDGEPESSTSIGLGSPGYAPIEQSSYKQDGTFPATLDVYSLGATLFKMLTGKRPPEATNILNEGFPDSELVQSGVSAETIAAIKHAMAPVKKNRCQDVQSFLKELSDEDCEETATIINPIKKEPVPESPVNPDTKPKLNYWLVYVAAIVIIVIGFVVRTCISTSNSSYPTGGAYEEPSYADSTVVYDDDIYEDSAYYDDSELYVDSVLSFNNLLPRVDK